MATSEQQPHLQPSWQQTFYQDAAGEDVGHIPSSPPAQHRERRSGGAQGHPRVSWSSPLEGHSKYRHVRLLDRGQFGFVELAIDLETGEQVAIKFCERGPGMSRYITSEVNIMKRLSHPHIIAVREVFLTHRHIAIAMEYAAGGNLYNLVSKGGGLKESDARWYFQQICFALDYCHRKGICNRDLKLENTLLAGPNWPLVKLCDFGYSKDEANQSAAASKVGTPAYLAPEVLSEDTSTYDGKMADCWSLGVMLYCMVYATYPFGRPHNSTSDTRAVQHMLERVAKAEFTFPSKKPISEACKDLISRILVVDPAKRVTLAEIQHHPWFQQDLPEDIAKANIELLAKQGNF